MRDTRENKGAPTPGQRRALRIVSNLKNLGEAPTSHDFVHDYIGGTRDRGTIRFIRKCFDADIVILEDDGDYKTFSIACVLRPLFRFRLISVSVILHTPKRTPKGYLKVLLKRALLSRVDRFILFFRDVRGYERFYGITPERVAYVPFKVNDWETLSNWPNRSADGDYVLFAGRTMRDIGTFVEAMRRTGHPAILLQDTPEAMAAHGTVPWTGGLPPNVELVIQHGAYIEYMCKARLVVIPRVKGVISASGTATYLVAMALNKCVIISEGPGVRDVLTDQAVFVPPEDPNALARQIELLWNDHAARKQIAARARKYAESVGGESRLLSDILQVSLARPGGHPDGICE